MPFFQRAIGGPAARGDRFESTDLDVWGVTAVKLGVPRPQSVEENTPHAEIFRYGWHLFRRSWIAGKRYKGSLKTVVLTKHADTPVGPYTFAYLLPADLLAPHRLNWGIRKSKGSQWELEGELLLTQDDGATLQYVYDCPVRALGDDGMLAMGIDFAVFLVESFPKSATRVVLLQRTANQNTLDASANDSKKATPVYRRNQRIVLGRERGRL